MKELIYIYKESCPACDHMHKITKDFAEKYPDILFYKFSVYDQQPVVRYLVEQHKIELAPFFIAVDGDQTVGTALGAVTEEDLINLFTPAHSHADKS